MPTAVMISMNGLALTGLKLITTATETVACIGSEITAM